MESNPVHVGFIMDGNRRAGREQFGSALQGYEKALPVVGKIVRYSMEKGIAHLTFYTFSTENWSRDTSEIEYLMDLFRTLFKEQIEALMKDDVRVSFIGRRDRLEKDIVEAICDIEDRSKSSQSIHVQIALDYGGRDELVRAVQRLLDNDTQHDISEADVTSVLDTAGVPDPDMIIRTGGERRLSGFLLWQASYAELYFCDTYWPFFSDEEYQKSLDWFAGRERRKGK